MYPFVLQAVFTPVFLWLIDVGKTHVGFSLLKQKAAVKSLDRPPPEGEGAY